MYILPALMSLGLLLQGEPAAATATAGPSAPTPVAAPAAPIAATPGKVRLAKGTELEIELVNGISSATSKLGERFAIRLASPIVVDGVAVLPAGALGEGEIIDARGAGHSGRQGKLVVSARFLDLNGRQTRVRGMTLLLAGKSRVDLATAMLMVPYVGLATIFVRGGDIDIPAGTRAIVKLGEDMEIDAVPATTVPQGQVQ